MTDDETDDDTLDVRSAEEIAREGIEAMAAGDEMTEREAEAIDERIDEIEDEDKRYSTEEAAEALGIDLDDDD